MHEKKIYLLLTDTGTVLTRIIKSYTKQPYNHISIAFDEELCEVYSFGRKNIHNPFNGGLVREDIHTDLFQYADCAVYSLTVTEAKFQQIKQYIQKMYSQKEIYHYNFLGLLGVLFNKPIKRKHAFFCSQFVATVLNDCDVVKFEQNLALIQPHELPKSADFQLIYEGTVQDYTEKVSGKQILYPYFYHSLRA